MSWNLGNVLARNRHVHRSIFQRRNGSRIVCWLFDLYCGLRLLCLRLWHSNGAWARMVAFWNFDCGRGVVCHGCMASPCCSHRHHFLFCLTVEIARKGGAKLIEMAESGERHSGHGDQRAGLQQATPLKDLGGRDETREKIRGALHAAGVELVMNDGAERICSPPRQRTFDDA